MYLKNVLLQHDMSHQNATKKKKDQLTVLIIYQKSFKSEKVSN